MQGEYGRAIGEFNQAIRFNPSFALAYNNRAIAYHSKGDYDQARRDFNKARSLNPRIP